MDIAALLESHRQYMLTVASERDYGSEQELANVREALSIDHDRATMRTLLDLYRSGQGNGEMKPVGQAASVPPPLPLSRAIKPGSKRAKDRARKAVETKRRKAADEAAKAAVATGAATAEGGAA